MIRPRGLMHAFYWTGCHPVWLLFGHFDEVRITARWMTLRAMGYSRAQIADMGIEG